MADMKKSKKKTATKSTVKKAAKRRISTNNAAKKRSAAQGSAPAKVKYVDGFVLPLTDENREAYKKMSKKAGKIWRDHGALEYRECIAEDVSNDCGTPFPQMAAANAGESVIFAWIGYKSRRHRDQVNKAVMADPRLKMDMEKMPFDVKRMAFAGFEVIVDA